MSNPKCQDCDRESTIHCSDDTHVIGVWRDAHYLKYLQDNFPGNTRLIEHFKERVEFYEVQHSIR